MITLYLYFEDTLFANCYGFISFVQVLGNLVMLVSGTYNRWGHAGEVCSGNFASEQDKIDGPYLIQAGSFMKIYLIILWVFVSILCCGICTVCGIGFWWTR